MWEVGDWGWEDKVGVLPYIDPTGGILGSPGSPAYWAEKGFCWQLSVRMKPVRSLGDSGYQGKAIPSEPPMEAASSQLVPWSRRDGPFLSISASFTGHSEVLQLHGHLKPPLSCPLEQPVSLWAAP